MEWKFERETKEYMLTACWFFILTLIYLTQLLEK